jgi:hypothetical protein
MTKHSLHNEILEFYFCTITCYKWLKLFEITYLYDHIYQWFDLLKSEGCYTSGYVIMPNHIHILFFLSESKKSLNSIVGEGKRFMAYEIIKRLKIKNNQALLYELSENIATNEKLKGKKHNIFMPSFDAKKCYSKEMIEQKLEYIHHNPMNGKWSMVNDPSDYIHSSASFYEKEGIHLYEVVHFDEIIAKYLVF